MPAGLVSSAAGTEDEEPTVETENETKIVKGTIRTVPKFPEGVVKS